ncbi:MAG: hypothetical protein IKL65_02795 [Bacilli bacterium]|nr:hypothetical protein [Bacilli bacterium]
MSLTVIGLSILGATVLGGGGTALYYYATEDDRARARIAEIDQEISEYTTIINSFNDLKNKLQNAKNYLSDSKTDFTNGGHVSDGVPLANTEFDSCIGKIDSAIADINNIYNYYDNRISELEKERKQQEAKL